MSKRGVSPLIATILLVGFTIAIGAMVSSFLIKNTQESFKPEVIIKDSEFCDSVSLGYVYNSSNSAKPWDVSTERFLRGFNITNKGAYSITNLTIKRTCMPSDMKIPIIDYSASSDTNLVPKTIKPGNNSEVRFTYNPTIKDKNAIIEFTPWIKD